MTEKQTKYNSWQAYAAEQFDTNDIQHNID